MKVQSVNSIAFSSGKRVVKPLTKQASPAPEELHYKKGKRKIMRRAFLLSLIMIAGAITYFKNKF